MDRIIEQVVFSTPTMLTALRVAAYTRVSSGKDTMLHSLSAQVSYYSKYIQEHPGWVYCGVYSDEAITGTKESRKNFQKLLEDCKAGKIDLVITKSISRFARNTVTLLENIRELKLLGVGVFFEEQNINTLTADGELMITILASYAQEESLSASENAKWRIHKDFEQGILPKNVQNIYGYKRTEDGGFEIIPEEAKVVQEIYNLYLDGFGFLKIAKHLNKLGVSSNTRENWSDKKVKYILSNEKYVGDLLLQKSFVVDHLTKKCKNNNGEKPQYYVKDNHPGIVSRDIYEAVQEEIKRRQLKYGKQFTIVPTYIFTGKIQCGLCRKNYRRKIIRGKPIWRCPTFDRFGKKECPSKQIPEDILIELTMEVLGRKGADINYFNKHISKIFLPSADRIIFEFADGHTIEKTWQNRSRSESWTDEMKEKARQHTLKRRNH